MQYNFAKISQYNTNLHNFSRFTDIYLTAVFSDFAMYVINSDKPNPFALLVQHYEIVVVGFLHLPADKILLCLK